MNSQGSQFRKAPNITFKFPFESHSWQSPANISKSRLNWLKNYDKDPIRFWLGTKCSLKWYLQKQYSQCSHPWVVTPNSFPGCSTWIVWFFPAWRYMIPSLLQRLECRSWTNAIEISDLIIPNYIRNILYRGYTECSFFVLCVQLS